ncbi:MAG: HAD-IA family hydrolase [Alphaproteobacteria bacterium]|nr:HAD-IA family hydrolase [Alphaproteobacteria bacterium]
MNYLINHFKDWKNTFEYIFTSSRLGVSKPNPAFFQMIQNTLHIPFSDICLIDDDIQNIKTATDLGMQTVLYQSLSDLPIITS